MNVALYSLSLNIVSSASSSFALLPSLFQTALICLAERMRCDFKVRSYLLAMHVNKWTQIPRSTVCIGSNPDCVQHTVRTCTTQQ